MRTLVILDRQGLVVQGVVKGLDGRQFSLIKFGPVFHTAVRIYALCKNKVVITQVFGCMLKVFLHALQQQTDKMVEGRGKTLKPVEELYVAYLKLEKPLSILRYNVDIIETCLLYTSPSPRDRQKSRMPSSA